MRECSSSSPENTRLDSALGRYAAAATAAIGAAASTDAAVTNLFSVGSFTLSGANDSASFGFNEAGISFNFTGYRSFFVSTSSTFISTSSPGPGYTTFFTLSTFSSAVVQASGGPNVRVLTNGEFSGYPVNLTEGASVNGFFTQQTGVLFSTFSASAYGEFSPVSGGTLTGYLGFRATIESEDYVGWLRVQTSRDSFGRPLGLALVPVDGITGAFAPLAEGIEAGQTAVVPEPAVAATGLGLLALGAAGLRRRRARAAAVRG